MAATNYEIVLIDSVPIICRVNCAELENNVYAAR